MGIKASDVINYIQIRMEDIRSEMMNAYDQRNEIQLIEVSNKLKSFSLEITDILYQVELSINTHRFLTMDKNEAKQLEIIARNINQGSKEFVKSLEGLESMIEGFLKEIWPLTPPQPVWYEYIAAEGHDMDGLLSFEEVLSGVREIIRKPTPKKQAFFINNAIKYLINAKEIDEMSPNMTEELNKIIEHLTDMSNELAFVDVE